jgi:DNA/RNA endonuclease YhcR with UshA esterase domain
MLVIRLCASFVVIMFTAQAQGQVSIGSLRSSVESSNLKVVTLEGVVHLARQHERQLGGRCGSAAFVLTDDTGSIEVAVRRVNRLIEPLREGDRVRVTAQIEVFRNRDNVPLRICVEATEIQHLNP